VKNLDSRKAHGPVPKAVIDLCCRARRQPSLGIGEARKLVPERGAQHAVLGAQVLDRFALPAASRRTTERRRSRRTSASRRPAPSLFEGRVTVEPVFRHHRSSWRTRGWNVAARALSVTG
jgi:hypothetical protein